jgi:DNA-binding SARP family transcriptional activator/tetratricopeptide (TPR) repeat protein
MRLLEHLQRHQVSTAANSQRLERERPGTISVLGGPEVAWRGRSWRFPTKAFVLFARLSVEPEGALPRREIREFLWAGVEPGKANANLRQTLARIGKLERSMRGKMLVVGPHAIALNRSDFRIDLADAIALDLDRLIAGRDLPALEAFVDFVSRRPLSGFDISGPGFEDWRSKIQMKLHRDAVRSLGALIADSLGDPGRCERFARKLLNIDPTAELGYRALMESHASRNERSLAVKVYEECQRALREELGTAPERATRELACRLGLVAFSRPLTEIARPRQAQGPVLKDRILIPGSGLPRIVLLPPAVLTDDRIVRKVASALVEEVISGLFRCRSFSIVAPHTAHQMGPDGYSSGTGSPNMGIMNIEYAMNTTIAPNSSGLGVIFRLTSCPSGEVLWVHEANFELDRLPFLFTHLSYQIICSVADAIERAELRLPLAADDATAYRWYLEGRAAMTNSGLPNLRSARNHYRRSIDRFGAFVPAIAGLARTLSMERLVRGLTDNAMLEQALALAERACEIDPFDARGYRERGFACLYLRRYDESLASFERAAKLNPNDADLLADYADALAHSGEPEQALNKCLNAMALNPLCPDYYHWILGSILFQLGDYEGALNAMEPVKRYDETARLMAACSALASNRKDAAHYAAVIREAYPEFRLEQLPRIVPDRVPRDTERLIDALRSAGVE